MNRLALVAALCLPLALGSCAQFLQAADTVCTDIVKMPPAAVAALDAQDPHSALGVLWADAKAACANGTPTLGVSNSWAGMIWGEIKVLIPQVLPSLLPLLIGLFP